MAKVILDADHGGQDLGAVSNGRSEKDDNLRLAFAVGKILQDNGIEVAFTRTDDSDLSIPERNNIIKQEDGDLLVTLSRILNSSNGNLTGERAFIYGKDGIEAEAALNINSNLQRIGFQSGGIYRPSDNVDLIRGTNIPAILEEIGFIDSYFDNLIFDTKINELADAISSGIIEAINGVNNNVQRYNYRIQIGLFQIYNNAINLQKHLVLEGYPSDIVRQGEYFSVQVGDFPCLDQAVMLERKLRMLGYNTLLIAV